MKIHQIRFQDIPFHRDLRCGLSLINYRHVVQHPITKRFPLTNLGKVLTLQYGEALSDVERAGGGYPVVGSNGVVGFHDEYVVEGPCIVLGRKGSAGEVTFVESNCFPIDTTFYVVRKTDSFNIKFLAYLLRVLRLQRLALLKGVPGLNRFDAYDVPIPLVPEDIQTKILRRIQPIEKDIALLRERIVGFTSIVNVEFAKAFNIDTTTIKNLASIKVLPTTLSVFSQNPSLRFSFHHQKYSNLTNLFGDSDFWQPLPKVFSVSGGKRVPKGVGFSPEETRFRYLRPNEVSFNEVNREEMPFLYERTYIRLKRYKINDGDFAISIVGTLGKTALVNLEELEVEDDCLILSENFAKLVPLLEINRPFYYYFFHTLLFQAQMEREYTIHTQKKLGLDKLANFIVPNLTSGKEEKIVTAIEDELSKQEEIKKQIETKRNEIDNIIEATLN